MAIIAANSLYTRFQVELAALELARSAISGRAEACLGKGDALPSGSG